MERIIAELPAEQRPRARSWAYWPQVLVDAIRPRLPVSLGQLPPTTAFTTLHEIEYHGGQLSGRVIRRALHGTHVLVAYTQPGQPGYWQTWLRSTTPVFRRHTCPSIDR